MSTLAKTNTMREAVRAARHDYLVGSAIQAARKVGFHALTRDAIAAEAGVSAPLVSHHLGDMDAIRNLIMTRAVAEGILALIAQGIAVEHPAALEAPAELRAQAAGSLA